MVDAAVQWCCRYAALFLLQGTHLKQAALLHFTASALLWWHNWSGFGSGGGSVHICVYTCVYVCIHVCVHVCVCVCVCVCVHMLWCAHILLRFASTPFCTYPRFPQSIQHVDQYRGFSVNWQKLKLCLQSSVRVLSPIQTKSHGGGIKSIMYWNWFNLHAAISALECAPHYQ